MQTLHTSSHYTAHLHDRAGLIVATSRRPGGVVLKPNHPQFAAYVDALKTAIDASEADALCRALLK